MTSRRATSRARTVATVLGAIAVLAVVATGPTAGAQGGPPSTTTTTAPGVGSNPGPSTTVAGQRAATEREVDVLSASRDDVRARVANIDRRLRDQEGKLALSQAAAEQALQQTAAANEKADRARAAADAAREDVRDYALEAFIRPPAQDSLAVLAISDANDAGYASDVLEIVADQRGKVVDSMVAAEAVANRERQAAEASADAAKAQAAAAAAEVADLEATRGEQVQLASSLDDRLDAKLAESAALKSIDDKAAKELADQELALRSSVAAPAAAPPTGTPASRSTGKASTPTTAAPSSSGGAGGSTKPAPTPTTTVPPSSGVPSGLVTWSDVVKVGGIWVHSSIASQVRGLLDAANAAGFSLSGGGFRDPASQISLRQAHCGTSTYAIYEMPASQCTPPTARPGTSMHERGLAMDLQSSGRLITTRSDPAFQWLAANASRFGFFNLPSEPWHWSVNGS